MKLRTVMSFLTLSGLTISTLTFGQIPRHEIRQKSGNHNRIAKNMSYEWKPHESIPQKMELLYKGADINLKKVRGYSNTIFIEDEMNIITEFDKTNQVFADAYSTFTENHVNFCSIYLNRDSDVTRGTLRNGQKLVVDGVYYYVNDPSYVIVRISQPGTFKVDMICMKPHALVTTEERVKEEFSYELLQNILTNHFVISPKE
ncbi:hypothetical protein N9N67_04990 [Bacteriovoracaceae bacterium]|nr:hypothetical protein [Bacteriovoracaceae bacterium]